MYLSPASSTGTRQSLTYRLLFPAQNRYHFFAFAISSAEVVV